MPGQWAIGMCSPWGKAAQHSWTRAEQQVVAQLDELADNGRDRMDTALPPGKWARLRDSRTERNIVPNLWSTPFLQL